MLKRDKDNITLKINLNKLKFPEDVKNVVGNFSDYLNKAGVWACYGLPLYNKSQEWVCLNVGQSIDIGREMRTNRKYSRGEFNNKKGEYKNYRGEVIFTFNRPKNKPITSRQRVWNHIGKKYKHICFVIVEISDDKMNRLKTEMDYAIKHEAIYWNKSPEQNKIQITIPTRLVPF